MMKISYLIAGKYNTIGVPVPNQDLDSNVICRTRLSVRMRGACLLCWYWWKSCYSISIHTKPPVPIKSHLDCSRKQPSRSLQHWLWYFKPQSTKVPEEWKSANITPLFKHVDRSAPVNYRPASLTSICSKVMEHIIHKQTHGQTRIISWFPTWFQQATINWNPANTFHRGPSENSRRRRTDGLYSPGLFQSLRQGATQ